MFIITDSVHKLKRAEMHKTIKEICHTGNGKSIGDKILYVQYNVIIFNIHNSTTDKKAFGFCDYKVLPEMDIDVIGDYTVKNLHSFSLVEIINNTNGDGISKHVKIGEYKLNNLPQAFDIMFPNGKRGSVYVEVEE